MTKTSNSYYTGSGPDKTDLIINYTNRECERLLFSIAQVFINLLRHIPNGIAFIKLIE